MTNKEVWRMVPGMDGVLASSHGRILLPPRYAPIGRGGGYRVYMPEPRIGCVCRAKTGAKHEYLNIVWRGKTYKVHQLVCAAFHGPKPFPKAVVIHLDENALNNRAENLKWGTQKENMSAPGFRSYCKRRCGDESPVIKGRKAA